MDIGFALPTSGAWATPANVAYWVDPENRDPLTGVGLATADEVWLPLDPRHVLMLSPDPETAEEIKLVGPSFAKVFNRNTVAHAHERVMMHPAQDHLQDIPTPATGRPVLRAEGASRHSTDGVNAPPERWAPRGRPRRAPPEGLE